MSRIGPDSIIRADTGVGGSNRSRGLSPLFPSLSPLRPFVAFRRWNTEHQWCFVKKPASVVAYGSAPTDKQLKRMQQLQITDGVTSGTNSLALDDALCSLADWPRRGSRKFQLLHHAAFFPCRTWCFILCHSSNWLISRSVYSWWTLTFTCKRFNMLSWCWYLLYDLPWLVAVV